MFLALIKCSAFTMNFHTILEYDIGDKITYVNEEGDIIDGQIYGFFDTGRRIYRSPTV